MRLACQASVPSESPPYQVKSFLVRLWQRPEGFRAEARPVTGGDNRTFSNLEQLFDFLQEQAGQMESY